MNCQDITRIANTGTFARLSEAERGAAVAHALTCPNCAPVWAAHARLAELHIPQMPSELSLRCQTIAAAGTPRERHPWQRLTLVGGALALVAAAGVLTWYWSRSLPSGSAASLQTAAPVTPSFAEPALRTVSPDPALENALPAAQPETEQVEPTEMKLPLVPAPAGRPPDMEKSRLALQKAVERHPEMVQGPQLDDPSIFIVFLTMRTDGTLLDSAAELASSPATYAEISNRLIQMLPGDAGEHLAIGFERGQKLSDGSALRARVLLQAVLISENFDVARSEVRVREILGHKYDDLMTSPSSDEFNLLSIFLSDDGSIVREKVERVTMQNAAVVMGIGTGSRQEETIAGKLGINVGQIGLIGTTTMKRGSPKLVAENGVKRVEGVRQLAVRYAWARRTEEDAAIHTPRRVSESQEDFDVAAALVVAERLLPDAFSHTPPSLADMQMRPTVVFTDKGEVMRAGRVQVRNGVEMDSLLQEQLVPGVSTHLHRSVRLTNKDGATAMVTFAWRDESNKE